MRIILMIVCAVIAHYKNRNMLTWGILGLLFPIITTIIIILISKKNE